MHDGAHKLGIGMAFLDLSGHHKAQGPGIQVPGTDTGWSDRTTTSRAQHKLWERIQSRPSLRFWRKPIVHVVAKSNHVRHQEVVKESEHVLQEFKRFDERPLLLCTTERCGKSYGALLCSMWMIHEMLLRLRIAVMLSL